MSTGKSCFCTWEALFNSFWKTAQSCSRNVILTERDQREYLFHLSHCDMYKCMLLCLENHDEFHELPHISIENNSPWISPSRPVLTAVELTIGLWIAKKCCYTQLVCLDSVSTDDLCTRCAVFIHVDKNVHKYSICDESKYLLLKVVNEYLLSAC